MRADQFGTHDEAARFSAGWLTASQRREQVKAGQRADGPRCLTCGHYREADLMRGLRASPRCAQLGIATRDHAVCDRFTLLKLTGDRL